MDAKECEDPRTPPKYVETLKGEASLVMPAIEQLGYTNVDRLNWKASEESRFVKDSKQYTPKDIEALAKIIREDKEHDHFIIAHGTDHIVQNANSLKYALEGSGKVVTFVGAIVPLSMHKRRGFTSDAVDTLKFALGGIMERDPGVYIVARYSNTKLQKFFDPNDVKKDRETSMKYMSLMLRSR